MSNFMRCLINCRPNTARKGLVFIKEIGRLERVGMSRETKTTVVGASGAAACPAVGSGTGSCSYGQQGGGEKREY